LPASLEPYKLTVYTEEMQVVVNKVFVGDVFVLAGQSNMEQTYKNYTEQLGNGVTMEAMPAQVEDERIKYLTLATTSSASESFDVPFLNNTGWQPLNSSTNKRLSHIGMFFAQDRLEDEPDVPIGLLNVAWGGTRIDAWIRKSDDNKTENYTPSNGKIYNNHIAPFTNYPVSAILWYQGESDSKNYFWYGEAFEAMVKDYRKLWEKEDLPFLYVQLARYTKDDYQYMRDVQLKGLKIDNTGMAVILDTDQGTQANIHPLGKPEVAERLYLLARKYVYGEDIVAQGPIYENSRIEGNEIIISFKEDTIGDGLCIKNTYGQTSSGLCEFEIAGRDGNFVKANAKINPDNTITIWADGVNNPEYARYAFSRVPENPNLFNENGLPASPFTTDERVFSAAMFFSKHTEEVDNGKVQKAEFVLVPEKDNINGVISFTGRRNRITGWGSCGVTIRFQEDGYFGYIDGSGFITSNIAYSKEKKYRVTIICDFEKKTYSAIINGTVMCEGAAFRDGALSMNNMGRFLVRGGEGSEAREFYAEAFPEIEECDENTIVRGVNGEEVIFGLKLENGVRVANYVDDTLVKAVDVVPTGGVTIQKMPQGENKVFFWDGAMVPCEGANILKPDLVTVSSEPEEENKGVNATDGNLSTKWAGYGKNQVITLDYSVEQHIDSVQIAFMAPETRMAYYNLGVSCDGENWETVFDGKSTGQVVETRKVGKDARYIRLSGRGTTVNENWLSINEMTAFN
ncbi:MAG: discoidin domain-containing protein, partial [Clostridia bacterium]|nr:discoidin domain-containing protein [Clostridia bacterium]